MGVFPEKLRAGSELTSAWLNKLLALARSCRIQLGVNSGLSMTPNADGLSLRLAQPNVQATLAYSGGLTARVGTTAGYGTVTLVDISVASDGITCTLTTTATQYTAFNFSAATGGIPSNKYCWIEQDLTGNWIVTSVEC